MRDSRPLPPLPILPGTRALHPREETGERGGFREVQAFSYLTDGERGLQQEVGSLQQEHLVDIVDDCAIRDAKADFFKMTELVETITF